MNFLKLSTFFLLSVFSFTSVVAQEWLSYEAPGQINELIDTGDELLLATDAGLVVVNKTTLEKQIFNRNNSNLTNSHIQSITQATNGSIWIGTYDVVMARFTGTDFVDITTVDDSRVDQNTELYDFQVAPNGDFWLATDDGVFHREDEEWTGYDDELGGNFFEAWDVAINDAGDVFVSTNGIFKFSDGAWTVLPAVDEFINYLGGDLFFSSNGDLYSAGDLEDIGRFNGEEWELLAVPFNGSRVVKFAEDSEGNTYLNAGIDGLYILEGNEFVQEFTPQSEAFDNNVGYFYIDDEDNKWMNSGNSLSVDRSGILATSSIAEHTIESSFIESIHKGENDKMYISAGENIAVLDTDGSWSSFAGPVIPNTEFRRNLLVLTDDDIYATTNLGLHHFDGTAWSFNDFGSCSRMNVNSQGVVYIQAESKVILLNDGVFTELNPSNSPLSENTISGLGIDANDNLWIASGVFQGEGTGAIQKVTPGGEWTTYTAAEFPAIDFPVGEFKFEENGNVWIPNYGVGAITFDGTDWTNPYIGNLDQMANYEVDDIEIDASGTIYLAHNYGFTTITDGEFGDALNDFLPQASTSVSVVSALGPDGKIWLATDRLGAFAYLPEGISSINLFGNNDEAAFDFSVFPNPATDYVTIDFTLAGNTAVQAAVYNQLGQRVSSVQLGDLPAGSFRESIDLTQFAGGIYTVRLQLGATISSKKFVVH